MDSRQETCLRCDRPVEPGFHACPFNVAVIDPVPLQNHFKKEYRTIEEELVAQGCDINEFIKFTFEDNRKI